MGQDRAGGGVYIGVGQGDGGTPMTPRRENQPGPVPEREILGRESIWSVQARLLAPYFSVFGLLVIIVTGLTFWREFANAPPGAYWVDTLLHGLRQSSGAMLWIAGSSLLGQEVYNMMYLITEKYMNKRYRAGRTEGRTEEREEWLAWLERREAAEREGREFTEPPPAGLPSKNGK